NLSCYRQFTAVRRIGTVRCSRERRPLRRVHSNLTRSDRFQRLTGPDAPSINLAPQRVAKRSVDAVARHAPSHEKRLAVRRPEPVRKGELVEETEIGAKILRRDEAFGGASVVAIRSERLERVAAVACLCRDDQHHSVSLRRPEEPSEGPPRDDALRASRLCRDT